jgi:hypothetical protein
MMSTGLDAETAIEQIRKNRAEIALFNNSYVEWLMSEGAQFLAPARFEEISK